MDKDSAKGPAERVKAFRERLDGRFKRIESYVTEEEKSRVQAVREREGVTMDIAVAGLVRLGLERYEELVRGSALTPAAAPVAASSAASVAASSVMSLQAREDLSCLSGALNQAQATRGVSTLTLRSAAGMDPQPCAPAESPVARFFRTRKEMLDD